MLMGPKGLRQILVLVVCTEQHTVYVYVYVCVWQWAIVFKVDSF